MKLPAVAAAAFITDTGTMLMSLAGCRATIAAPVITVDHTRCDNNIVVAIGGSYVKQSDDLRWKMSKMLLTSLLSPV